MNSDTMKTGRRRNDIQGLRAVGALLVAVYHIWIGRVSGGVDVFFIVSGFLLIGSLGRELQSCDRIDLFSFLSRLAHRLLPAAFLVILAITATGWLWMPKIQWDSTIEHLAASTLYLENWLLAFNSVDYLARETTGSPVQHYWAMSAQVQSLVIVAILLTLVGWTIRNAGKTITESGLIWFLGCLSLSSFCYSVLATAHNQAFAYFDTFARVWEFTAGGLLAIFLPKIRLGRRSRLVLGWTGFVAILLCGVIIDVSTHFPGYVALWPISAAAMILVAGDGKPLRGGVEQFLGSRPLVWLGNISYSLYLWHWPVLIAYLTLSYKTNASLSEGLAILFVSIALAYLTERYIEQGFKAKKVHYPLRTLTVSALSVGAIGFVLLSWNEYKNVLIDKELSLVPNAHAYPGSEVLADKDLVPEDQPIYPGLLTAAKNRGTLYQQGCVQTMSGVGLRKCTFGSEDAKFEMVLVGGSHSAQWVPAFIPILKNIPEWKLTVYTKAACPFSTEPLTDVKAFRDACREWNSRLREKLLSSPPDALITLATRTTYPQASEREHVPQGYRDQWLPLLQNGVSVIALRDTPRYGFDVPVCIDINGSASDSCVLKRDTLLESSNPAEVLEEANQLNLLDFSNLFCTDATCPPVIGNLLVYRDEGHVSAAYMKTLAAPLEKAIVPLLANSIIR